MDPAAWDAKYAARELLWSEGPNRFLPLLAEGLAPGRALDLACGEGRNALWLAAQGWQATGVDFSPVALARSRRIAAERGLGPAAAGGLAPGQVELLEADLLAYEPARGAYDLVIVFYLQLPAGEREPVWRRAAEAVTPGGTLIVVGHDSDNRALGTGGPKDPAVLYGPQEIAAAVGPEGAGLAVETAKCVSRPVPTEAGTRFAIDALVRATRPAA